MVKPARDLRVLVSDKVYKAGYLQVPHLLNRNWRRLGMDDGTYTFVLQLLDILIGYGDVPKNLREIAQRLDKGISTVRGYSHWLNVNGLLIIRRQTNEGQQVGNDYDLTPLWKRLEAFADAGNDQNDGIVIGPPIEPVPTPPKSARPFKTRQKSGGPPRQDPGGAPSGNPGGLARQDSGGAPPQKPGGFNEEDDQDSKTDHAADAATIFTQICSEKIARDLVAKYPAAIPHAVAIVEEASKPTWEKGPLAALRYLLKCGWTPPPKHAGAPDSKCPGCGGDIAECHGIHGWAASHVEEWAPTEPGGDA